MFKHRLLPLAAACVLLQPLMVSAKDSGTQITLTPPEQMPAAVGTVSVQCSRNMNGSVVEIYRVQEEGAFLYYTQRITLCDGLTVNCPLWEGDYRMVVSYLSDDSTERREHRVNFTIDDPDMDPAQSFDTTLYVYHFDTSPEISQDTSFGTERTIEKRTVKAEFTYQFARADFAIGDLNADGLANASDAAAILIAAAAAGAGEDPALTALQMEEADLNGDQVFNSADAAELLVYSADFAAGNFSGDLLSYVRENAENATNMAENAN